MERDVDPARTAAGTCCSEFCCCNLAPPTKELPTPGDATKAATGDTTNTHADAAENFMSYL